MHAASRAVSDSLCSGSSRGGSSGIESEGPVSQPSGRLVLTQCSIYADDMALGTRAKVTTTGYPAITTTCGCKSLLPEAGLERPAYPLEQGDDLPVAIDRSPPILDTSSKGGYHRGSTGAVYDRQASTALTGLPSKAATAVMLHGLPLVQLPMRRKDKLEKQHRLAIRALLGLPCYSPVSATLAQALASPLAATTATHAAVGRLPAVGAVTGRCTPASELQQAAAAKILELAGLHLAEDHLYASLPQKHVAVITVSRPELQASFEPDWADITVSLLLTKLMAMRACGITALHWVIYW
ncbi:hypothetical protein HPB52_013819 [Rhipicephalus sanguineus]|uniref:Uncharacterized protein n=1 Tax=Rhipicephalus sanguineus TaxID=34632 RepID=A0A9D4PJF9_RHISA|nr:hypothetical protein HPB52_013819 [Rhipicephalus sanguineus]